jgi:hypothetical protein
MSNYPERWEVYISKEEFEMLRSDASFLALLPLARVVNALRFCFQTLLEHSSDDKPSGLRQHINSFLFACGVLYEGLKIANTLGKQFGSRKSFRDGFGKLLKSKETKKLNETVLNPMRNKLVFHFDEDVAPSVLKNLDLERYAFATADGSKSGEIYYDLADEVAINFIIGEPGSRAEEDRVFREILKGVSIVMTEYVNSADSLIVDVLKDLNWKQRERKKNA